MLAVSIGGQFEAVCGIRVSRCFEAGVCENRTRPLLPRARRTTCNRSSDRKRSVLRLITMSKFAWSSMLEVTTYNLSLTISLFAVFLTACLQVNFAIRAARGDLKIWCSPGPYPPGLNLFQCHE
jgi:hypothetical protein